ncbi:MAG: glycosyltransferase family 9 protein, partial [Candidatus Electrothrix sp. EH2]|nr:glycosyltransferase family 9 protein [Candidatus Electrothrix sp. EH2]
VWVGNNWWVNNYGSYLGIKATDEDFHLRTAAKDRRAVRQFLQSRFQSAIDSAPLIYANPAARWQSKFWPIEHWAALCDKLHAGGLRVVFGGSPQDTKYLASITQSMKTEPIIAAGILTLPQSAVLIQQASLYIGLDSGPMHIAALARTPVVALFGPTHPSRVGPYNPGKEKHRILRAEELDCLECRKRSCSHRSCMRKIAPEMVYKAARTLLDADSNSGKRNR